MGCGLKTDADEELGGAFLEGVQHHVVDGVTTLDDAVVGVLHLFELLPLIDELVVLQLLDELPLPGGALTELPGADLLLESDEIVLGAMQQRRDSCVSADLLARRRTPGSR